MNKTIKYAVFTAVLSVSLVGASSAFAMINSSLDLGDTGSDVSELQTFLSTDSSLYPSRLVTGYFGPLTEGGVQKFQTVQNIVSSGTPASTGFGRVGPITRERINGLLGGSYTGVNNQVWDAVPILSASMVSVSTNSATVAWSSNEVTQGQVFYSTSPIIAHEATGVGQTGSISGTLANDNNGMQTNHSVNLSNLQSNTTYYFVTRGIDSAGNSSVVLSQTFRTN